jgi:fructose-bisphosphate aldolase, class I
MKKELLEANAGRIVERTILAADESSGTIEKRLKTIDVRSTPETNRAYRLLLFETPGIERFVSGVILYDETIRQKTDAGQSIPQLLAQKGIVPGIKVDKGTVSLPGLGEDKFTQGLDKLGERLKEYSDLGAVFAKWRAVIAIDEKSPSPISVDRNAHDLALYAAICQENGLVPIVEPEVLMDGSHSMRDSKRITHQVLESVFRRLGEYGVHFGGMILKPNMVTPDKQRLKTVPANVVAITTLDVLRDTVPTDVRGIAFLSGGQSPEMATVNLNAINYLKNEEPNTCPWGRLTASYGRALQGEALEAWRGKAENISAAQTVFMRRAEKVYQASKGQFHLI